MRNPRLNGSIDSNIARLELGFVVDGRADVLAASRRNFQLGATQIKIMTGGGVATEFDPWHSTTFTLDELKAAVEVAVISIISCFDFNNSRCSVRCSDQ